jgi:hypothetical protein
MKLRCALLVAFALALLIPVGFASASPVDPSVIINHCIVCDATTFSTNSVTHPLVIMLNSQGLAPLETFEYTGTAPLTKLYVELDGALPLEEFDCLSNIFTGCGSFSTGVGNEVGLIFEDGRITHDETFTAQVTPNPEPATIVLLLTGGALLIGLGRRWQ